MIWNESYCTIQINFTKRFVPMINLFIRAIRPPQQN